jgi:hypothetical protein
MRRNPAVSLLGAPDAGMNLEASEGESRRRKKSAGEHSSVLLSNCLETSDWS